MRTCHIAKIGNSKWPPGDSLSMKAKQIVFGLDLTAGGHCKKLFCFVFLHVLQYTNYFFLMLAVLA
jgi:hypothetical protein